MSGIVANIGRMRWEVELGRALEEFETSLSTEQRAGFQAVRDHAAGSPPTIRDVMNLTAEVDYKARHTRCFGPRLTRMLESVQQYASIGDVIFGASQNLLACGVWSLVRISLLTVCKFSAYLEKLSVLFMKVGQSAPVLQEMASLFPHSKPLRDLVARYFVTVVRVCQTSLRNCQQESFIKQLLTQGGDITQYESELILHGDAIKDRLQIEHTKVTSSAYESIRTLSAAYRRGKDTENHARLLDLCSTYNFKSAWKRTRKLGNTVWLVNNPHYYTWLNSQESSSLIVRGKLGSGKSVVLANMVDDINLKQPQTKTAYFFCREDDVRSLDCRTIIGCIARQLLQPLPPEKTTENSYQFNDDMDSAQVVKALKSILRPSERIFLVLDGLEACSRSVISGVSRSLCKLQKAFNALICMSCSVGAGTEVKAYELKRQIYVTLQDDRPDIKKFIKTRLRAKLNSGELCLRNPKLVLDIQKALESGAQGMFLWAHLQIEAICQEKSDPSIREALKTLPRSLPQIYQRILDRCRQSAARYQVQVLQILGAALRPLSLAEFEEAISIIPGDSDITRHLVSDVYSVLASCGSLVVLDEEQSTLHFTHHSAKRFIFGQFQDTTTSSGNGIPFSEHEADSYMGKIVVTYLSWEGFNASVSGYVTTPLALGPMPGRIIESIPKRQRMIQVMAIRLLEGNTNHPDMTVDLTAQSGRNRRQPASQYNFLRYAQDYWLHHTKSAHESPREIFELFKDLTSKDELKENTILWKQQPPEPSASGRTKNRVTYEWAIYHSHEAMLRVNARHRNPTISGILDLQREHHNSVEMLAGHKAREPNGVHTFLIHMELKQNLSLVGIQQRFLWDLQNFIGKTFHLRQWGKLFDAYRLYFNDLLEYQPCLYEWLIQYSRTKMALGITHFLDNYLIQPMRPIEAALSQLWTYPDITTQSQTFSQDKSTDFNLRELSSDARRIRYLANQIKTKENLSLRLDEEHGRFLGSLGHSHLKGCYKVAGALGEPMMTHEVHLFDSTLLICSIGMKSMDSVKSGDKTQLQVKYEIMLDSNHKIQLSTPQAAIGSSSLGKEPTQEQSDLLKLDVSWYVAEKARLTITIQFDILETFDLWQNEIRQRIYTVHELE